MKFNLYSGKYLSMVIKLLVFRKIGYNENYEMTLQRHELSVNLKLQLSNVNSSILSDVLY